MRRQDYPHLSYVQKQIEELNWLESEEWRFETDDIPLYDDYHHLDDEGFIIDTITIIPKTPTGNPDHSVLYFPLNNKVIATDRDFVESILSNYLHQAPTESETRAIIFIDYISMNKLGESILLRAEEINVKLWTETGSRVEINMTQLTRK